MASFNHPGLKTTDSSVEKHFKAGTAVATEMQIPAGPSLADIKFGEKRARKNPLSLNALTLQTMSPTLTEGGGGGCALQSVSTAVMLKHDV